MRSDRDEKERALAIDRYVARAEHRGAQAARLGWLDAADLVRDLAGKAFNARDEARALMLRDIADNITTEAHTRWDPRVEEALVVAVQAEEEHLAEMDRDETLAAGAAS